MAADLLTYRDRNISILAELVEHVAGILINNKILVGARRPPWLRPKASPPGTSEHGQDPGDDWQTWQSPRFDVVSHWRSLAPDIFKQKYAPRAPSTRRNSLKVIA
jgi:hypothetical protein